MLFSLNQTEIRIYVNGTLEGVAPLEGVPYVSTNGTIELKAVEEISSIHDVVIGATIRQTRDTSTSSMFSGLIDDVSFYDSQLDDWQIFEIFNNTHPTKNNYF